MSPIVQTYEARLLGPLTYHSVPDAGAAGATVTAPFLGDVALTYGLHYAVHGHPIPFRFGARKPDYAADYRHFATVCSVGVPQGPVEHLSPEYVASSFMSEGYEQKAISSMDSVHRKSKVSNTPYRPWRQIQSLAPTRPGVNLFRFSTVSRRPLRPTFTLRIGLGRACLVEAVEAASGGATCAVNRQTVESYLGRAMDGVPHSHRTALLAAYQIYHGVPIERARDLLAPAEA